jgi:hypothetical protein
MSLTLNLSAGHGRRHYQPARHTALQMYSIGLFFLSSLSTSRSNLVVGCRNITPRSARCTPTLFCKSFCNYESISITLYHFHCQSTRARASEVAQSHSGTFPHLALNAMYNDSVCTGYTGEKKHCNRHTYYQHNYQRKRPPRRGMNKRCEAVPSAPHALSPGNERRVPQVRLRRPQRHEMRHTDLAHFRACEKRLERYQRREKAMHQLC